MRKPMGKTGYWSGAGSVNFLFLFVFYILLSNYCVFVDRKLNKYKYIYDNQSTHLNAMFGNTLEFHPSVIDKTKSQGKSFHNTEL